jgi:plasmid stabilization system protein ParE
VIRARFHPDAAAELEEAAIFYEAAQVGLGRAFGLQVERVVDRIKVFPESGAPFGGAARAAIVRNFPFWVVYRVLDTEVLILAIAHQRRRPGYWRKRNAPP